MSDPDLHTVALLMGDASRAAMLVHLMGGRHLPASELSQVAHIAPATASEHLAKLVAGGLVTVHRHGRHRYFALAGLPSAEQKAMTLVLVQPARPRGSVARSNPSTVSPVAYLDWG